MDAGRLEASSGFRGGADVVTVLGAADDRTIRGALEAAAEHGGELMADLINVSDPAGRARELAAMGVRLLCVHTAHDVSESGGSPLRELAVVRDATDARLAVAGGLTLDGAARAVAAGADILIVGSAITGASAPRADRARKGDAGMSSSAETVLAGVVAEIVDCLGRVDAEAMEAVAARIAAAPRVFLAGAGRSGCMVRAFAVRLAHLGMDVHLVGDATTPAMARGDLLLVGSGSGRTPSLLAVAGKAKEIGAEIVLLTIDPACPMGALADTVVAIPAPSSKAATREPGRVATTQPMGSLFEQSLLLVLDAMVLLLMERLGQTPAAMFARHANLE
jgi:6-phospho 3-hexuloisomerase